MKIKLNYEEINEIIANYHLSVGGIMPKPENTTLQNILAYVDGLDGEVLSVDQDGVIHSIEYTPLHNHVLQHQKMKIHAIKLNQKMTPELKRKAALKGWKKRRK